MNRMVSGLSFEFMAPFRSGNLWRKCFMKPTRYIKIQETLEKRISEGRYPVGSKLPTEEGLAKEFGVNRHTIRRALKHLLERGYIKRGPRVGSVVVSRTPTLDSRGKVTVKYVYFSYAPGNETPRDCVIAGICADFNADNPGVEVVPTPVKRSGLLFSPHIPTHDNSGAVLVARVDYLADYARRDVFLPLDSFEDFTAVSDGLDARLVRYSKNSRGETGVVALPIQMAAWMMVVNLPLFEEFGFSEEDVPSTWGELLAVSAKIAADGRDRGILPFEPLLHHSGAQSMTRYLPYLYSVSEDGLLIERSGKLRINVDAATTFLEWVAEMYGVLAKPIPLGRFFTNGKAVFRFSATAGMVGEMKLKHDLNVALFPIPRHEPAGRPATVLNAAFAGIVAPSANSEAKRLAAWRFIKHLASSDVQKRFFDEFRDLPSRLDMAPIVAATGGEVVKAFEFATEYGKPAYDFPFNTDVHRIVLQAFANVATRRSTPAAAVSQAQFMLDHYAFDKTSTSCPDEDF
jgi:ABC-type glycerol-3-phosphate transport system substrate-binding protein